MSTKPTYSALCSIVFLLISQSAIAVAYEKKESDYGYKTVYIENFKIVNKQYGNGPKYKEVHLVYKETYGGDEHNSACLTSLCEKFITNKNGFEKYIGKRAKLKIDDRLDNNEKFEEVIMGLSIIK